MSEQVERDIVRARVQRRLRRRERWFARRDDDESDSEDESSSPAAAASTDSSSSSSAGPTISLPASQSASITSTSSSVSSSAAPTALPIVESSATPFPITSSSSSRSRATTTATSISTSNPFDVTALLPSRTAIPMESSGGGKSAMETRIAIGAGVTSGMIVLLGVLACFCLRRRYKRRRSAQIENQSSMSAYDPEPLPLMRGALGPTSFWRPWQSTRSLPRPYQTRSAFTRSWFSKSATTADDDQDRLVANGMRPSSVASDPTEGGRRGWYSVFSGSERIISILPWSQRQSSHTFVAAQTPGKSAPAWPTPSMTERSVEHKTSPFLRAHPSVRRSQGSRFVESRFSTTDRTNSIAPTTDTLSRLYERDSITPPNGLYRTSRTSTALEREYLSLPIAPGIRNSTATSNGGVSVDSMLHPPTATRPPGHNSVGSLRNWLAEQRRNNQNMERLP